MTIPKEINKALVSYYNEIKFYEFSDKEFNIIILRKLNEVQINTDRQLNTIRKTMEKQNEKFNKEIDHKKLPNRNPGAED